MERSNPQLREDALAIWRAAVAAVDSKRLVMEHVRVEGDRLHIADETISLSDWRRIVIIGAGKAGAGMAEGLELALGDQCLHDKDVIGWVNVPDNCVRPIKRVTLYPARPAGVNEPTETGAVGASRILKMVQSLGPADLCFCLISGGGSALLPAPLDGIRIADKQAVTQHLSGAGANIHELNTVRKQLSRIKGGGLARACRAGRLITLIISDVLGDPLETIASGPTIESEAAPEEALGVLEKYHAREAGISDKVFKALEKISADAKRAAASPKKPPPKCHVTNLVIGNNATAVDAAGKEAEKRGYSHAMTASTELEGAADGIGRHHARMAVQMRREEGPDCLITGGEPTVELVDQGLRGKGGRNQQLVLAAFDELTRGTLSGSSAPAANPLEGMAILSGGTDGEDGPTDAAGAIIDARVFEECRARQLDSADFLRRNDAYGFFDPLGALLKTGPTHTNVCDVRVVVVSRA